MSLNVSLPGVRQPVIEAGGTASRPYYVFFQTISTTLQSLSDQIDNVTTTPTESPISENANVVGKYSIYTRGILKTGIVSVLLIGDVETPGKTQYYGSDATGEKGWFDVSDTLDSTSNITLTVGSDGVTTLDLSAGVLASLALADSSVQPGDLAAVATSGAYGDLSGLPTLGTAAATDTTDYATAAQGALADTALQDAPSDGTIYGRKDGGWVLVPGGAGAVDSVNGQTGAVVLDAADVGAEPTITAGTSSQFWCGDKTWQDTGIIIPPGYIDGLRLVWISGTALTVTSGAAYIEGAGKILRSGADIAKTGLSLTASTWYHVYLYDNAGTPDIEVVTTAPATAYNGTARSKTGDSSRRYIGSVKTDASGNLYSFIVNGGLVSYREDVANGVFRLVSAGTPTTETSVSCASVIPPTASVGLINFINTATSGGVIRSGTSDDNFAAPGVHGLAYVRPQVACLLSHPLDSSQAFTYWFDAAPSGGSAFINALGYLYER